MDRKTTIYLSEINEIKKLNNINLEKIMFVLLVYSKWLDDMKWFSIIKNDLSKEAKISNVNSINQQKMLCDLFQLGYLGNGDQTQNSLSFLKYFFNLLKVSSLRISLSL